MFNYRMKLQNPPFSLDSVKFENVFFCYIPIFKFSISFIWMKLIGKSELSEVDQKEVILEALFSTP